MTGKIISTKRINAALRSQLRKKKKIRVLDLNGQHAVAAGLAGKGTIEMTGTLGHYFGAMNDGHVIIIEGTVGRWAGAGMTGGGIIINGDADRGIGAYMSGGVIIVRGKTGEEAAIMNQGGTVIVDGDAGDRAATGMFLGDLIITGSVGEGLGEGFSGGAVYIGGSIKSISKNIRKIALGPKDIRKLETYFEHYGIDADAQSFAHYIAR